MSPAKSAGLFCAPAYRKWLGNGGPPGGCDGFLAELPGQGPPLEPRDFLVGDVELSEDIDGLK